MVFGARKIVGPMQGQHLSLNAMLLCARKRGGDRFGGAYCEIPSNRPVNLVILGFRMEKTGKIQKMAKDDALETRLGGSKESK
jgi:hypothetical protein